MGENTYIPGKIFNGTDAAKHRFVTAYGETSPDVDLAGAGEVMSGVLQNAPSDNEECTIVATGPSFLEVNGNSVNIAIGDRLKSAASGIGVKADTDGDIYGAVAREASTADNTVIRVDVVRPATESIPA